MGRGTPPAVVLTAGNRNDISHLLPLVHAIPPLRGRRGRPRRRPSKLFGDRAYQSREARRQLRRRHPGEDRLAPRARTASGWERWVVERTIAWLHQHRRLRLRYELRADVHEAFLSIACSLICLKQHQAEESFC